MDVVMSKVSVAGMN